ncbi:MAG: thioredoxin [Chitinophagales bacterium]|nr:thioredoxin [Chitinophagales bacterium]
MIQSANKLWLLFVTVFTLTSCNSTGQPVKNLNADAFEKGISSDKIQLVDVRTPEEYSEKRILNSTNINVNGSDFEKQMGSLDKNKPTYFYCLAGSRSATAANWAVKNGFKEVYNLEGGITAWIGAKKPVEVPGGGSVATGMSFDDYLKHVKSDKLVLVDFNATWCGPCKILKPIVEKVVKKNASKVQLFDIDVDKNPDVANAMNVKAIPLLLLYKNGKEVWRQMGLTDEATLTEKVKEFGN